MKGPDKKAAVLAYKERKVVAGIYAVHCKPTDQHWVGGAPDVSTIQNRLWFSLRQGSDPHRSLQAAWREHGIDNFAFDIVEQLDPDAPGFDRDLALKQRATHWRSELKAEAI